MSDEEQEKIGIPDYARNYVNMPVIARLGVLNDEDMTWEEARVDTGLKASSTDKEKLDVEDILKSAVSKYNTDNPDARFKREVVGLDLRIVFPDGEGGAWEIVTKTYRFECPKLKEQIEKEEKDE